MYFGHTDREKIKKRAQKRNNKYSVSTWIANAFCSLRSKKKEQIYPWIIIVPAMKSVVSANCRTHFVSSKDSCASTNIDFVIFVSFLEQRKFSQNE